MKFKLVILLLGFTNLVSSQINYQNTSWFIKGNATSLIDLFTFPTVQFSAEKPISNLFSICSEAGYQLYNFRHTDTSFVRPTGFKVNLEFRYYISKFIGSRLTNKVGRVYAGIRPFYSQNIYNSTVSYKVNRDSVSWLDDDFSVKNRTFGLNFTFGFQKSLTERLIIDMHTGLGIMKRTVTNADLQYNKDSGHYMAGTEFMKLFKSINLSQSSGIWGNLLIGVRVGYTIYKK
jgi:hypothetical protein